MVARPRPVGGPRPARGTPRARDRAGGRTRDRVRGAAGIGQDAAGADDPRAAAAARGRGRTRGHGGRIGGGGTPDHGLIRQAPFRAPHHTTSYAAMVGGGPRLSPGEVTLADHGVLFLDELPEFGRDVLEALRQPLEEGRVAISRVGRATTFPARFQLVAAMNPCPCGFAGDDAGRCRCPTTVVERYTDRVSGPLRDRIDLWVTMPRVPGSALVGGQEPEGPGGRPRIAVTRARQTDRSVGGSTAGCRAARCAPAAVSTRSRLAASSSCPSMNACPVADRTAAPRRTNNRRPGWRACGRHPPARGGGPVPLAGPAPRGSAGQLTCWA